MEVKKTNLLPKEYKVILRDFEGLKEIIQGYLRRGDIASRKEILIQVWNLYKTEGNKFQTAKYILDFICDLKIQKDCWNSFFRLIYLQLLVSDQSLKGRNFFESIGVTFSKRIRAILNIQILS